MNIGRVVPSEDVPHIPNEYGKHKRERVCECDDGFFGERCENEGAGGAKPESVVPSHEDL